MTEKFIKGTKTPLVGHVYFFDIFYLMDENLDLHFLMRLKIVR